jgi:hypothetical protein
MPTFVYRLNVSFPRGTGPGTGWQPGNWEPSYPGQEFSWPPRRSYVSWTGAQARKRLLESWGATVTVSVSDPVTFPDDRACTHAREDAPDGVVGCCARVPAMAGAR